MRYAFLVAPAVVGLLVMFHPTPAKGLSAVWRVEDGGNGHVYEVVSAPGITWSDAQAAAEAAGGHLATITSEEENEFVFSLSNSAEFWNTVAVPIGTPHIGPWLGGFQTPETTEPDDNWQWVTGESFNFTNWHAGEPNDHGASENRLGYGSWFTPDYQPLWYDAPDAPSLGEAKAYVVEFPAYQGALQPGDADQDMDFDQFDLVRVQQAAKYMTGQSATWGEGDWDGAPGGSAGSPLPGNVQFDQFDIVAALRPAHYLQGHYAALSPGARADAVAIPEPMSALLLAIGLLLGLACFRRANR